MKVRIQNKNLFVETINDDTIYWSYNTPIILIRRGTMYYTTKKYSQTTSRHVSFIRSKNWNMKQVAIDSGINNIL